ncbi:MAG TPA: division/cell wall cluster transcriptional repressor MraZ [Dehalococcoidia bacterium]|nr:division/cell wall cluster transcriptional repressor MraZ [Dehalococcoidia bacterium]
MGFRGNFEHTLDDRGRVAIPAKYRSDFAAGAVLTPHPDGCLQVYTDAAFNEMSNEVASRPATVRVGRQVRRAFDGTAFEAELDRQGRILVPARFREQLGLNGSVVIVGTRECLEIWRPEAWERELEDSRTALSAGQEPVD